MVLWKDQSHRLLNHYEQNGNHKIIFGYIWEKKSGGAAGCQPITLDLKKWSYTLEF